MAEVVEVLVDGGKASGGPPIGPALGPLGVNIGDVVNAINEKTKDFAGMKVPVKITVDPKTKNFDITIGTPPATALIKSELGLEKGSSNARTDKVGNLTIEQALKITRMKSDSLTGKDMKGKLKEIIGTCVTMGVTVEGKDPREVQKEIDQGVYDDKINN